jgi:hypothetical protein
LDSAPLPTYTGRRTFPDETDDNFMVAGCIPNIDGKVQKCGI